MSRYDYKNSTQSTTDSFLMDKKERENKAFDLLAEMLIKKIEDSAKSQWKKPWITEGQLAWPKALYGKPYNGTNALMLTFLCEEKGYKIPVFATSDRIFGLNKQKDSNGRTILDEKGRSLPAVDKDGNKLPFVHVLKGEKSFPVFLSNVNIVHKETREKIKWSEYITLSQAEQNNYNLYFNRILHNVFNVDQTNLKEARPELYQKLMDENLPKVSKQDGPAFCFEPLDKIVSENRWICDIQPVYQDQAYYSISQNRIVIPEKRQFTAAGCTESYYGTMLHEMFHSTGAANHLDRLKPTSFGSAIYAREELLAELGAAMTCHRYGISKGIKEDSIPYVKEWLHSLREDPPFIRTILKDVKLAMSIVTTHIDAAQKMCLGEKDGNNLDIRVETESSLDIDEDGGVSLGQCESLEADKKQGCEEGKGNSVSQVEKAGEHRSGIHF